MGVPKFYRWVSERYPCLSEVVKEFQIPEFDNLYLDMNGIIHVSSHPDDDNPHFRITEEKIFADIMYYIEFLFRMIKPRKVFFMAVDGVAPRAKMNQQRGRRFRAAREAEEGEKKALAKGEKLPEEKRFDSNCITPGTPFMVRLNEQLKYFVVKKASTDPLWRGVRVFLSGHETPGEGEHKVMDFIRAERATPDYDPNTRHCLYGLDADLMMLGLATHEPHFSLLREEVRFGGKRDQKKRPSTAEETTFHLLHLSLFREYLDFEFSALKKTVTFPYNLESIIDDWVMMGFLVGNDFIPHLPNLHINHDALPLLWKTYIDVLPSCGGYINNGGYLNLERFEKYLTALSQFDIDTFSETAGDLKWLEGKKAESNADKAELLSAARKLRQNIRKSENLMQERDNKLATFAALEEGVNELESPEDISEEVTLSDSDTDDTLDDEFIHHKRNYYMTKMDYEKVTPEVLRDQAEGYVRGIQWILLYYYEGVPSWSWFYSHHYAPYMSDVRDFKDMKIEFDLATPFLPFEQLMAVLPALSKDLLPKPHQNLMTLDSSPVIDFYPETFDTDLNGKQQDWEAVVLIPFIDENRLLSAMRTMAYLMTDEERARNRHGPHLMYEYTPVPSSVYQSPLPEHFPDIAVNYTKLTEVDQDGHHLESRLLKKGMLPGALHDVYFPGFPTLKHIAHTAELKKEAVKIFQMNSRGYNTMLHITPTDEPDIDQVAKEYLGKDIWVSWPHLYEAKVVAVCDDQVNFSLVEGISQSKGAKSSRHAAKAEVRRDTVDQNTANIWHREVASLAERYKDRLGVIVGSTNILLRALPMTGRKYAFASHGRITMEKQWGTRPVPFPLQTTVKDIATHDSTFCQFNTLQEYLPEKTPVFMLGWPHYGCQGEVIEVEKVESGRVRINMTIFEEPKLSGIMNNQQLHEDLYVNSFMASQKVGINANFLARITGSVFVTPDAAESDHGHGRRGVNIGLNLKFTKRGEEVPGYAKMFEGQWTYSQKTIDTLMDYMRKFPEMFETITRSDKGHNDMFYESDVIPEGCDYNLKDVQTYIKALPCSSLTPMKTGADIISEGVIKALQAEAQHVVDINKKRQKRVKMQVKPHLLFRSLPTQGAVIPDSTTTYSLFDRVVNVREGYSIPFGLRGTVVGIQPAENEVNTIYEVMFDEEFTGAIAIRNSGDQGYRMPPSAMLNLTHGERKNGVKPLLPQPSQVTQVPRSHGYQGQGHQHRNAPNDQSYASSSQSNYGQKQPNNRSGYQGQGFQGNQSGYQGNQSGYQGHQGFHDNRGVSSGSYSALKGSNQQKSYDGVGGWGPTEGEYDRRNREPAGHGQQETQRETNINKQKANQGSEEESRIAGQVFNGAGTGSHPKFVTPKVAHGTPTARRTSSGDGKTAGPSGAQDTPAASNFEFENMWKQLKAAPPPGQGSSLQDAAAVLPKVPSPMESSEANDNNSAKVSTVNVQNVTPKSKPNGNGSRTPASRVVSNDEFSAMFKSLEVSSHHGEDSNVHPEEREQADFAEDGSDIIKKMLHIDSDSREPDHESADIGETAPPSTGNRNYGKQVSVQELFDVAKHKVEYDPQAEHIAEQQTNESQKPSKGTTQKPGDKPPPPQQASSGAHQSPRQGYPPPLMQQQLQPTAMLQQTPLSQKRPNLLVPTQPGGRNPVMELMTFCQSLQFGLPMYDYLPKSGMWYCVVTFINGARFQGSLCKTKEEAAESSAGVALLQMKSSMQQMAQQPLIGRLPGGYMPGMIPQGRQFSSPNSAFSPVPAFTDEMSTEQGQYVGPQYQAYNQRPNSGGHKGQQFKGHRQQQQQPSSQISGAQGHSTQTSNQHQGHKTSTNQNKADGAAVTVSTNHSTTTKPLSANQIEGKSTCVVTPFVPLQVTKKQTPQKRKDSITEDAAKSTESLPLTKETTILKRDANIDDKTPFVTDDSPLKPSVKSEQSESAIIASHTLEDNDIQLKPEESTKQLQPELRTPRKSSGSPESSMSPKTPPSASKRKPRSRIAANFSFGAQ